MNTNEFGTVTGSEDNSANDITSQLNDIFTVKNTEGKNTNLVFATQDMYFDRKLQAKAALKDFKNLDERQRMTLFIARVAMYFFTFVYLIIVPLVMTSDWCLDNLEDDRGDLPRSNVFFL